MGPGWSLSCFLPCEQRPDGNADLAQQCPPLGNDPDPGDAHFSILVVDRFHRTEILLAWMAKDNLHSRVVTTGGIQRHPLAAIIRGHDSATTAIVDSPGPRYPFSVMDPQADAQEKGECAPGADLLHAIAPWSAKKSKKLTLKKAIFLLIIVTRRGASWQSFPPPSLFEESAE